MTILISLDDTDTKESRGTGRLARSIAGNLHPYGTVTGVTRHQLLVHPDIQYTSHNSCAVIHLCPHNGLRIPDLAREISRMMLDDFIPGSDPGLAVEDLSLITPEVIRFGQDAKQSVLTRNRAKDIAKEAGTALFDLGGTGDGIIGALAGLGLAASGNDGRYVFRGRLREFMHEAAIEDLLESGVDEVHTTCGESIRAGDVRMRKFPKPSLRNGRAVLFVEQDGGWYREIVRD